MERLLCATMLFAICCFNRSINGTPIFAKEFVHIKFHIPADGYQHRFVIGPKPSTAFVTLHKVTHHHHYHKLRKPFGTNQPHLQHSFHGDTDNFQDEMVLSEAKNPMKSVDEHFLNHYDTDTEVDVGSQETYFTQYEQQFNEEQKPAMAYEYHQQQGYVEPAVDTSFDDHHRPWQQYDNSPQSPMPVYPQAANFEQSISLPFDTIGANFVEKPINQYHAKEKKNIFNIVHSSNSNNLTPFNDERYHSNMPNPNDYYVPAENNSTSNEEEIHFQNPQEISDENYDEQTTDQPETKSAVESIRISNTRFTKHNMGLEQINKGENHATKTENINQNHKNIQDKIFSVPSNRDKFKFGTKHKSAASATETLKGIGSSRCGKWCSSFPAHIN